MTPEQQAKREAELAEEYLRRSRRCTSHLETQTLTNWYAQNRAAVDSGLAAKRAASIKALPTPTPERLEHARLKAENPVAAATFLLRNRAAIFPDDDGGPKAA